MAAYETRTKLEMVEAVSRAREFFEMRQGLTVTERLGARYRWQDGAGNAIALRAFPIKGGGTRLELDTLQHDAMVLAFIRALPQPSLLDELRRKLRR